MARPVVVRAADGELIDAAGVAHLFKLTGGRLGLERFEVPPLTVGAGPHVHGSHDEYFYVLAGALTLTTDDGEVTLGAGDLAAAPRGSLHGYRNASADTTATALCLYTPPGYEQYFRDVHAAAAEGAEVTPELLAELRSRYDTESR
ncbi:cupin domain-containing protein [Modestobacter versicolor]|uniref:Quercetin dioxygenase-like cupin family protein n=1 Tax=Modestobacter versicolor TaxID=429133 RepID=A0A839Y7T5_9ACTN|nr:cupin domain-containing protein [Modestobacter versicolor]MBB3676354.1 quercetin dioxygenase-like cupin family protein [Modestobacter versicolor]